ncbi:unnamed protein product [Cylicostephanus goldi]|uniref:Uncharacterized protein n=1 Tax=Cylicostephanus goldi TaxID=71465 RepID=A0A3P6U9Y0_CYLGO|nr:unnamed protein product [Cylicostephanus goldi]
MSKILISVGAPLKSLLCSPAVIGCTCKGFVEIIQSSCRGRGLERYSLLTAHRCGIRICTGTSSSTSWVIEEIFPDKTIASS